jgi:predicted dehydrogenase
MIQWAVCGSGNMASLFLSDSQNIGNGEFIAVYSSAMERANAFAEKHSLAHAYDNLDTMLANPDIDAVYIASTHPNHAPQAIKALNAGKHVLVEKPMSLTKAQAQAVFDAAKANNKLCCEALWTKFFPTYKSLMTQIGEGRIGDVRHYNASFGFTIDMANTTQRLLNPEQAGGALLDIGLYPIFVPLALFGTPDNTKANITMSDSGVDIAADIIMEYKGGRTATVSYRFDCHMPNKAAISGTKGWVELEAPFHCGNAINWGVSGKPVQPEHHVLENRGWGIEFEGVNAAIESGALEAPEHTWAQSLQLAEYLEMLRKEWGPTYPFE